MRAKKLRVANQEGAAKATSGILSLRSPNRMWQTRRKSALFPHCCRIATFFVSSLDAALSLLSCNLRARRFLFPTIPMRRILSVTNVTSLVFIFFVSDTSRICEDFLRAYQAATADILLHCSSRISPLCTLHDNSRPWIPRRGGL